MFVVSDAEAAAIRAVLLQHCELSATIELAAVRRDHRQRAGTGVRPYDRVLGNATL